jgi:predicted lipase
MDYVVGCFQCPRNFSDNYNHKKDLLERFLCYYRFQNALRDKEIKDGEEFLLDGYKVLGFREVNVSGVIVESSLRENLVLIQQSNDWMDFAFDSLIFMTPYFIEGEYHGEVHSGFLDMWLMVRDRVSLALHTLDPMKEKKYTFLGHSLGSALSLFMADYMVQEGYRVEEVLGTGSPRVGNKKFGDWVSDRVRVHRLIHKYDVVPAVPPPGLYRHIGEAFYMLNGKMQTEKPLGRTMLLPYLKSGISDHYWPGYLSSMEECLKNMQ